jgi:hypothetical protein
MSGDKAKDHPMSVTQEQVTQALKPCPFCGVHLHKMSEQRGYFHDKRDCPLSDFHMEADGYSEARWNQRTEPQDASRPSEAAKHVEEELTFILNEYHRVAKDDGNVGFINAVQSILNLIPEALRTQEARPSAVEALREAGADLADAARSEWDTANRASPQLAEALAAWDFALLSTAPDSATTQGEGLSFDRKRYFGERIER